MPFNDIYQGSEQKMNKALDVMKDEFKRIRTGRATPGLVENIKVDYYGTPTMLKQLATISIPEPKLLIIKPFDVNSTGDIEKAILKSEIGITPNNDGKLIRLVVPPLSEERRKQLTKGIKELVEKAKISIRNIRRDAIKQGEDEEEKKILSEDDKFRLKEKMQELTTKKEKESGELLAKKTKEIMGI
ncbi:MAG: ribosome recycling factor [Planctomycetes bacterium]|nr:ribosome recycling factor [Planctomycetota bacterium]